MHFLISSTLLPIVCSAAGFGSPYTKKTKSKKSKILFPSAHFFGRWDYEKVISNVAKNIWDVESYVSKLWKQVLKLWKQVSKHWKQVSKHWRVCEILLFFSLFNCCNFRFIIQKQILKFEDLEFWNWNFRKFRKHANLISHIYIYIYIYIEVEY